MSLFETLSSDIIPQDIKPHLLKFRIKLIEQSIRDHMVIIHDLENDIEQLKQQLHDLTKTPPHPANTLVDDDDVPAIGFV